MADVLVVGGAGYIGSHMCKALARRGYRPVVLDNVCYGHSKAVKWGPFVQGCMEDADLLDRIYSQYSICAVMHFAAFCYVGESVVAPSKYYHNNVVNTLCLLDSMIKNNITNFIFSSTCATYGEPHKVPIDETHSQHPINPYGKSKLMVEQILADFGQAYGLESVSLRYFNASGADPDGEIGEDHNPETHLIPLVLQTALDRRQYIEIYGNDYPTPDGTCIRDYIHVEDLSQAHLLALERLLDGAGGGCYNLGNGEGCSVQQVIDIAKKVTGKPITTKVSNRRPGDPAVLVGSSKKAISELGWKPKFDAIETILETAWNWHKANPEGYGAS